MCMSVSSMHVLGTWIESKIGALVSFVDYVRCIMGIRCMVSCIRCITYVPYSLCARVQCTSVSCVGSHVHMTHM